MNKNFPSVLGLFPDSIKSRFIIIVVDDQNSCYTVRDSIHKMYIIE